MIKFNHFKIAFRVELNKKRTAFLLEFDHDYGFNKRCGWSCAINGSFYVEFVNNPAEAVWTAIKKHRAAERDMAEEEKLQVTSGSKIYWDKADAIIQWVQKETGDWRSVFEKYDKTGSSGLAYIDHLIPLYDKSVYIAKELEKAFKNGK